MCAFLTFLSNYPVPSSLPLHPTPLRTADRCNLFNYFFSVMESDSWGLLILDVWNYIFWRFLPLSKVSELAALNSHFQKLTRIVSKLRIQTLSLPLKNQPLAHQAVPLPELSKFKILNTFHGKLNITDIFSGVFVALSTDIIVDAESDGGATQVFVIPLYGNTGFNYRIRMEVSEHLWDVQQAFKDGAYLLVGRTRVFVYSSTGQFLHELGDQNNRPARALKVFIDQQSGEIYCADCIKHEVSVWSFDYKHLRNIACKSPIGMGVHEDRLFVVSDLLINIFNKNSGAPLGTIGVPRIYQLAIDSKGTLITCNVSKGVMIYSTTAISADQEPLTVHKFPQAWQPLISDRGNLYVIDASRTSCIILGCTSN